MLEDLLELKPEGRYGGSAVATIMEALVLSRMPGSGSGVLLTHHTVGGGSAQRRLGVGTPVTKAHAIDLLIKITGDGEGDFLPPNVVCHNASGIAWHTPARSARMHWKVGSKAFSYMVPWPALYFVAGFGNPLRVFALASNDRPNPATPLFHAPLGNVYPDGRLCWGNIEVPERAISTLPAFEAAIYASAFTHTNNALNFRGAKRGEPAGLILLWEALHKRKAAKFPSAKLVLHKLTAGTALQRPQ